MKKLFLCLFLLTSCSARETITQEIITPPAETQPETERVGGGMEVYPYPTLVEDPDYDMNAAYDYYNENGTFPPDLNMNVLETYDHFNPIRLLEEDPLSLLPNFAGYDYETKQPKNDMDPETLKELQSIALELETPATGDEMTVSEVAQLSNEDWQEPIVFFTNLQKLNTIGSLDFVPTKDYAYHYRDDEYGDYEDCDGFTDSSYTPFIVEKNDEGKVVSLRTSFSSTTVICGPSGGGAGTYLDILVQLDEQGRVHRITGIYPDRDELSEGPLFADYIFDYADESSTDYQVSFIAANYRSNQMIFSNIEYTYIYPFNFQNWYWY